MLPAHAVPNGQLSNLNELKSLYKRGQITLKTLSKVRNRQQQFVACLKAHKSAFSGTSP